MTQCSRSRSILILTLTLFMTVAAFAKNDRIEPVGPMSASPSAVTWQPSVDHEKIVLVVQTPDGTIYSKEFNSGTAPMFRPQDLPGKQVLDGAYQFQLRVVPRISADVKRQLAAARAADDDAAVARIQHANGLDRSLTQSGTITVKNGAIINSDVDESASVVRLKTGSDAAGPSGAQTGAEVFHGRITPMNQVVADNQIVQGSLCVGLDCATTETFGFETIKLKENNTRILFDDTSTSTGFPNVDWQLVANDSGSGGANKFTIQDVTNSKNIFEVMANAPTDSIFVNTDGKIGFGNSAPALNLHITATDTPAIRQEQTNGGGFTAQTWDIGGNEANWFVRDVTGGSKLPLRIRPGAATSSIDIAASGNVGVGTASPSYKLHAYQNADVNSFVTTENPSNTTNSDAGFAALSNSANVNLQSHATARTLTRWGQTLGGWSELIQTGGSGMAIGTLSTGKLILGTNSTNRLQIDGSTGAVTISGALSVTGTKNFVMPDPRDPSRAIYYAALEGPEAGTYVRGTAKLVNGEAVITLPEYFSTITEKERMTVQLTPIGAPGQLYVASRSPEKIVVKTATKESNEIEFDYLVQGIRKGYLDYQVERPNDIPRN